VLNSSHSQETVSETSAGRHVACSLTSRVAKIR